MKKYLYMLLCLACMGLYSCSETDDTTDEYANWQERNETYFKSIYSKAESNIQDGKTNKWKILKSFSKVDEAIRQYDDKIVVEVLHEGTGSGCPLYTDSVRVHYEGRLMPTTEHAEGYVFDRSWTGDYNPNTMVPSKFVVNGVVDGFSLALQNMHIGDRWRVYMPSEMAYKSSNQSTIPAYSTLIFDITLHSYTHPGTPMPKL